MKSRIFFIPSILLIVWSIHGCAPSTKQAEQWKLEVLLDRNLYSAYAPLYSGIEEGYFTERGIDIEIKYAAENENLIEAVADGKADIAVSSQPEVIRARSNGMPVVSIVALLKHPYVESQDNAGLPDYYGTVLIAHERNAHENILDMRSFIFALSEGYQFAKKHPEEAYTSVSQQANNSGGKVPDKKEWDDALLLMDEEGILFGSQSFSSWEKVINDMIKHNLITKPIDPKQAYIDLRD